MFETPSDLVFASRRSPVIGRNGMVAASEPLAVAAGLEALSRGGNAADAAVATAAALAVTEPTHTGLGGDCFALFYDAQSRKITALNGSGRAPLALTLQRLQNEGFGGGLPPYHAHTVTVPGACAGWVDVIERHGRLALGDVLAPAIRLAENGFPVAPITSYFWQRSAQGQLGRALGGQEMLIDGRGPKPGEIFHNPGMARTLGAIVSGGKEAFYRGAIAEAIVRVVQQAGGCLAMPDLAAHTSTWDTPISTVYRGVRLWECPPNGQGLTALMALNILEGFDLAALAPLSSQRLHLEIEALRLAFADTRWYVADPAFRPAPLDELLSPEYAASRRRLINLRQAMPDPRRGAPHASSDTVYLSAVDGEGNACSFINSNYMGFGTGLVPSGWGFTLQNRGHNFSLVPGHPNQLEPGKRPYHTIIPAMATYAADDRLYASYGVMGGFMQPQGHVQVLLGMVEDGLDPQAALDRPRFCLNAEAEAGQVALEDGLPLETVAELSALGHQVSVVRGMERSVFGRGQVIRRDPESGVLWGGSDPRADGCAMTVI